MAQRVKQASRCAPILAALTQRMEMNNRPISQDIRNIAQRDLKLAALSLLDLGMLIEEHRHNLSFSSQIIVDAARQILAAKRAMEEQ